MTDISNINDDRLFSLYVLNGIVTRKEYKTKSADTKKKLMFLTAAGLPGYYENCGDEVKALFKDGADIDAALEFLSECDKEYERRVRLKREKRSALFDCIPADKKRLLSYLCTDSAAVQYLKNDRDGVQLISHGKSYIAAFTLLCEKKSKNSLKMINLTDWEYPVIFDTEKGLYSLSFTFESDQTGKEKTLFFSDFDARVIPVNACRPFPGFYNGAYYISAEISQNILAKKALDESLCNDREKALFPLLAELSDLLYGKEKDDYPVFEKILKEHGEKKAASYLSRIGVSKKNSRGALEKLLLRLNDGRLEHIWRGIYEKIYESQSGYADANDILFNKGKYAKLISDTDKKMQSLGYGGKYPDYVKNGQIRRPHLFSAENGSGVVFPAKDARFFVTASPCADETGGIYQTFYSGFAVNKNKYSASDIYSCLFYGGKALFYVSGLTDNAAEIAAKLAELKKLTKSERDSVYFFKKPVGKTILKCMLIGLLFGLAFLLVGLPLFYLFTKLDGNTDTLFEFIRTMPVLPLFLFTWFSYGGVFSLLAVFTKRM